MPRRSQHWITARRAWFQILPGRFLCGDWVIPFDAVDEARLFQGRQYSIPVSVLELSTADRTYQFGFNPWVSIEEHLPFEVEKQTVRFGYSTFSLALRVLLVGFLAFLLWRWLS